MAARSGRYMGRALDSRWTPEIPVVLAAGPCRFGALQRTLGHVSTTILLPRLREFERRGLVAKAMAAGGPPEIAYALTEMGWEIVSGQALSHEV